MVEIADEPYAAQRRTLSRSFVTGWIVFIGFALVLYGALYAWSESLVYQHGDKNRFFMIATAPPQHYDFAILGASHAMPLGFEGNNEKLEQDAGASVINLSVEGAGILPNQLMIDYFLTRHSAGTVVFFLDSFAFYSRQWNEDRLDTALFKRAPFDPALVTTIMRYPWARSVVLPYVSGFTKINDQDRFAPDLPDAEINKFSKIYRPIPQIDRQRVSYLYPPQIDPAEFQRYLAEFSALADLVRSKGGEFIVVKPPTPARYRDALPDEAAFDAAIGSLLTEKQISYYDLSTAVVDDAYFYDTDHLNSDGVATFIDAHFAAVLQSQLARTAAQ